MTEEDDLMVPKTGIETGYGVPWPRHGWDAERHNTMAAESRFEIADRIVEGRRLFLHAVKPLGLR